VKQISFVEDRQRRGWHSLSNGDESREIAGVRVLRAMPAGLMRRQRQLSDTLLARIKSGVVILAAAATVRFR